MNSPDTPVPTLLAEAAWGGGDDVERLYSRYRAAIRRYILRTFGSGPPDPDDVVQVAFEKYAALRNGGEIVNPKAFLARTARNYVIDQRRRLVVRAAYSQQVQALENDCDDLDGERVLEARERWAAVAAAIEGLDARSRQLLIWNRIHGLSCAEIARREGCSATLVKTLVARALVACQQALRDMGA